MTDALVDAVLASEEADAVKAYRQANANASIREARDAHEELRATLERLGIL